MKLLISQRESIDAYGMEVDVLEAAYVRYFAGLGHQIRPIPNFLPDPAGEFADEVFDGLVLTGGGSIPSEYYRQPRTDHLQPHRDRSEKALLDLCREQGKPILAICRGMQYLNGLWGGKISHLDQLKVPRPVRADHPVEVAGEEWLVNQYHNDGIYLEDLAPSFMPLAIDHENGVVEAFSSGKEKILGIQWHPERPFFSYESREKTRKLVGKFLLTGEVRE